MASREEAWREPFLSVGRGRSAFGRALASVRVSGCPTRACCEMKRPRGDGAGRRGDGRGAPPPPSRAFPGWIGGKGVEGVEVEWALSELRWVVLEEVEWAGVERELSWLEGVELGM